MDGAASHISSALYKAIDPILNIREMFKTPIIPSAFLFLCALFLRKQSCDVARVSYAECDHTPVYPLRKCRTVLQANGRLKIVALYSCILVSILKQNQNTLQDEQAAESDLGDF